MEQQMLWSNKCLPVVQVGAARQQVHSDLQVAPRAGEMQRRGAV